VTLLISSLGLCAEHLDADLFADSARLVLDQHWGLPDRADALTSPTRSGGRAPFVWSAVASFVMVLLFLLVPMDNTALFWLGIPLNIVSDEVPTDGTLYDRAVPD
jgi:hypothetical protein